MIIKKLLSCVLIIAISATAIACSGFNIGTDIKPTKGQKEIYDQEARLIEERDSFTFINKFGKIETKEVELDYSGFTGMQTLWKIDGIEEGTITLTYNSTSNEGEFKVVLITPEGNVKTIFEGTKKGEEEIDVEVGQSRIKMVGREAKGNIEMTIEATGNVYYQIVR